MNFATSTDQNHILITPKNQNFILAVAIEDGDAVMGTTLITATDAELATINWSDSTSHQFVATAKGRLWVLRYLGSERWEVRGYSLNEGDCKEFILTDNEVFNFLSDFYFAGDNPHAAAQPIPNTPKPSFVRFCRRNTVEAVLWLHAVVGIATILVDGFLA